MSNLPVLLFMVRVHNDEGVYRMITAATSEEAARDIVEKAEVCPPGAIGRVVEILPTCSDPKLVAEELEYIKEQMNACIIEAWEGNLGQTVSAVALADFDDNDPESGDEPRPITKYNHWYELIDDLIFLLNHSRI